jgi:hypothetical protein
MFQLQNAATKKKKKKKKKDEKYLKAKKCNKPIRIVRVYVDELRCSFQKPTAEMIQVIRFSSTSAPAKSLLGVEVTEHLRSMYSQKLK